MTTADTRLPGDTSGDARPPLLDLSSAAIFLDVDGTLVDIAASPEAVVIEPGLPQLLEMLRQGCGGALALVTGREIAVVDRFFAPYRLPVAGIHGAEIRLPDGGSHDTPVSPALPRIIAELGHFVEQHDGLLLEQKGRAVAVHYRLNPDMGDEVQARVRDVVGSDCEGLEIQPGKMVVEVRPARAEKGKAIEVYMEERPFAGRTPLFIGDDWTDESAFNAVNVRNGRSIRVGHDERPTEARERLPDPTAVRAWLAQVAAAGVKL